VECYCPGRCYCPYVYTDSYEYYVRPVRVPIPPKIVFKQLELSNYVTTLKAGDKVTCKGGYDEGEVLASQEVTVGDEGKPQKMELTYTQQNAA